MKIEIRQDLALERQAFDAHMRIDNGLDGLTLESVGVEVDFADERGKPILATSDPNALDALFFVRIDSMEGIADVSGAGTVQPSTTADIHWLIIPARGAGADIPSGKLCYVGATLRYLLNGEEQVTEVSPDYIFVKPLPFLSLDCLLTREVYADDAFALEVEPPEPFSLGLRVRNNGQGTACNVKIDSAQPRIVDNEQGLLVRFQIVNGQINDLPAASSLLLNLGNIEWDRCSIARWNMITSLSGQFVSFEAGYSPADELGGELTSLLDGVTTPTHALVHDVLADLPGRDAVKDFLARGGDVLRVYESDCVDTPVSDRAADCRTGLSRNGERESHGFQSQQ